MKLLVFDVLGRMANFRKIYSTSTSLSYFFPPRTTVTGLIAGLLGFERDHYYEEFLPQKCRIAVRILSPLRKLVQPVNYLNLDAISETTLRGLKKKDPRVPTSIEFIMPESSQNSVIYRVFAHHEKLMDELEKRLMHNKFAYPPSLGPAYCLAEISSCDPLMVEACLVDPPQNPIKVSTVIKGSKVVSFPRGIRVNWESRVPVSFLNGRKIDLIDDYICQPEGEVIEIQVKEKVFSCKGLPPETYGTFME